MINIKIKKQNRSRVFTILVIGGLWGVLDSLMFKGVISFLIDGVLILVTTVLLGALTNYLLKKIGFEWSKEHFDEDSILDIEFRNQERIEVENNDDIAALNYGIIWAILFLISTF